MHACLQGLALQLTARPVAELAPILLGAARAGHVDLLRCLVQGKAGFGRHLEVAFLAAAEEGQALSLAAMLDQPADREQLLMAAVDGFTALILVAQDLEKATKCFPVLLKHLPETQVRCGWVLVELTIEHTWRRRDKVSCRRPSECGACHRSPIHRLPHARRKHTRT
jgi:hypothetical protein